MMMSQKLSNSQILQIIITTYTSSDTLKIQNASNRLRKYVVDHYPSSFRQLQDILSKEKRYLDANHKKSIINLARIAGFDMLKLCTYTSGKQQQIISRQKNVLFTIEHIIDNKEIQSQYRMAMVQPFVQIFVSNTPQNYAKILSKSRYYLNTKQQMLGLHLLQAYRHSKILLKFKIKYYEQLMALLIQYILNKQTFLQTNHIDNWSSLDIKIIKKYIQMFEDVWLAMTFQKHQAQKNKWLNSIQLLRIFSCLIHNHNFKPDFVAGIYSIIGDIVMSLGRCHIYKQYQHLMNYIKPIIQNEFLLLFNPKRDIYPQTQGIIIKMITNAVKYKLIDITLDAEQLFSVFIYPTYTIFQHYFNKNSQNIQQILHFIDDVSFYMESSCLEITRNQLLLNICQQSQQTAIFIRNIFYTFYSHYLPQITRLKPLQINNNYTNYNNFWQNITQKYGLDVQILSMMLHTSIFISFFLSDFSFIKMVQQILSNNAVFFLKNQNPKIIFYSLLIYRNYMDDCFDKDSSIEFRQLIIIIALGQYIELPILNELAREILKQRFKNQPVYQDYEPQILMIVQNAIRQPKEQLYSLFALILKLYGDKIGEEATVRIISGAINNFRNGADKSQYLYQFLGLFRQFFNIDACKEHYEIYMTMLIGLAQEYMKEFATFSQQFLHLVQILMQKTEELPQKADQLMMKLQVAVNSKQILKSVNIIVSKSKNKEVLNWLIHKITSEQLTIISTLALHNIIYYAHFIISLQSIKKIIISAYYSRISQRFHFDYLNGKVNLIFIYLFRYCWKQTNHLLLNEDWSAIILRVQRDILIHRKLIGREEELGVKPFIEQIYDLIYKQQNIYRWKYDIQIFLKLQLEIVQLYLQDDYQLMYANMIFVAITINMKRASKFITNNYQDTTSQSDQSLHPRTNLQRQYRTAKSIVQSFRVPKDIQQKDYFSLYKNWINLLRRNLESEGWLNRILQIMFKSKGIQQLNKLLIMQKNQSGVYRKINKIKRMKNEDFL